MNRPVTDTKLNKPYKINKVHFINDKWLDVLVHPLYSENLLFPNTKLICHPCFKGFWQNVRQKANHEWVEAVLKPIGTMTQLTTVFSPAGGSCRNGASGSMAAIVAHSQSFHPDEMVDSLQYVQTTANWVWLAWHLEALCSWGTLWKSLISIQSHWVVLLLFCGVFSLVCYLQLTKNLQPFRNSKC